MENKKTKTIFVTICGRPNVGKSTLLNALMGKKISIVSPKAQTTRLRVTGVLTKDNCQYVFLDTPGLNKADSVLGQAMAQSVSDGIENADITLFVISAGDKVLKTEKRILNMLKENKMRAFLIVNKCDAVQKAEILETISLFSQLYEFEEVIPVSAVTGLGLEDLLSELERRAQESVFYFETSYVSDMPNPYYACEVLREKMLYNLGQEVPHTLAVVPESFKQDEKSVSCSMIIYCTRESHKGIIIGKNGQMLKKTASQARLELEKYFGKKVYLECFVKIKNDWQNSSSVLTQLGM